MLWDFIFHQDFVTEADKKAYLVFLRSLLKDRPYVRLAYMTGILPISKYSSGSHKDTGICGYFTKPEDEGRNFFGNGCIWVFKL